MGFLQSRPYHGQQIPASWRSPQLICNRFQSNLPVFSFMIVFPMSSLKNHLLLLGAKDVLLCFLLEAL